MFHLALKVLYSLMFVYRFLCSGMLSLQPAESPVCPIELQGFLCRSCLKDHHTDWLYTHKGSTNNHENPRRTREPRCCDAATVIAPGQLTHGRVDYLKVVRFFCSTDLDHYTKTPQKKPPRGRLGDSAICRGKRRSESRVAPNIYLRRASLTRHLKALCIVFDICICCLLQIWRMQHDAILNQCLS